jgi:hypothetical protein
VFKILAKENKTLNFSELTIEDFNANAGVITLKAKPTSTVYKTGTTFPVYVNLSHAVRIDYTTTNLVRATSGNIYSPTFTYHDQTVNISSNSSKFKFEIIGGKSGANGSLGDVNGDSTIRFDNKDGKIQYYAQNKDFAGGIYTVKVTYTVQETFEDKTGEVKYSSY